MRSALAILLVTAAALAACDAPHLGSTAQEALYTTPATYDFGLVALGTPATPRTIVVGVSGTVNESHTITNIYEDCADFSLDLTLVELPAEVSRTCEVACPTCVKAAAAFCTSVTQRFVVGFTPTVAGPQSCTITIELDDTTRYVTVDGTGTAPDHALTLLTPPGRALAFGDVRVGDISAALPITVRNDGTMDLTVAVAAISAGDIGQFAATGGGAGTLVPGEEHTYAVSCNPAVAGALAATFTITSDDDDEPTLPIDLTCNGIQSDLSINPSPARAAETFVGATSDVPITLHNNGSAAMNVDSITMSAPQFTVSTLADPAIAPGADAVVTVTFAPDAAVADQDVQATMTVAYDGGQVRTIDVVGPARTGMLSVSPGGEVDFGAICAGRSARRLFAAINLGSGGFLLTGVAIAGDGFTIPTAPDLGQPLPPRGGATIAFEVEATPPLGEATGTLTVAPNAPGVASSVVTLLARGQPDGTSAAPAALAFDAVEVTDTSGGKSVRLNNCAAAPMPVTGASITGRDAAEFTAVTTQTLPGSIAAYGGAEWIVELRPTSAGDKEAALVIEHAGGPTTIPLTGLGIAPPVDDDGRGTYYSCDAGGASGAGALALVMLGLALGPRRRRREEA